MSFDTLVVHLADAVTRMHAPGIVAVVLIDGFGCCGKSTLARALAVRTDAIIQERNDFQQPLAGVIEHDSPLSYRRWSALEATATALAQGRRARYAPIDWETHRLHSEVEVAPKATLIIDDIGWHALSLSSPQLRIFVDGLAESRMQRVAARDGANVADWDRYVAIELAYVRRFTPWKTADLHVLGAELTFGNSSEGFARPLENGAWDAAGRLDRPDRP
jgi:hypothetical protein